MVSQNSPRRCAVKFYRAQEFKNYRLQLQEVLGLHTASNVNVLVKKMNDLVSRLLATQPDWEKTLATQMQGVGDRSKWLESDASLQAVISAAKDPVLGGIVTKKVGSKSKSKEMHDVQSKKLSELRDKMETSVDKILCKGNMDLFELKLAFQTQQLQDSIESSAQFVVRKLSGPYDRLQHEVCRFAAGFLYHLRTMFYQDLRELWKEMVRPAARVFNGLIDYVTLPHSFLNPNSWIFCVDNKLLSSALYLDFFSASRIKTLDSDSEAKQRTMEFLQSRIPMLGLWTISIIMAKK